MAWKGFDIDGLEHTVTALLDELEVDARTILDDIAREAVGEMQRIIETAITETGLIRAARGGHPGRIDTGNMLDDVARALETGADGSVMVTWGWVYEVQDYYLRQEHGDSRITAMSALQQTFTNAREKLHDRLRDIGLEVN
jgi:hypothetical protein